MRDPLANSVTVWYCPGNHLDRDEARKRAVKIKTLWPDWDVGIRPDQGYRLRLDEGPERIGPKPA